jgi:transposase-like protein
VQILSDDIQALLVRAADYLPEVAERLRWLLHYAQHRSVSATCRQFTIARTTFYRWARRFDAANRASLADRPTARYGPRLASDPLAGAEVVPENVQPAPKLACHSGACCSVRQVIACMLLATTVVAGMLLLADCVAVAWLEGRTFSSRSLAAQAAPLPPAPCAATPI